MSRRHGDERGATVPEYALMVALVAVALILVLGSVRDKGTTKLNGEDARVGVIQDNAAYQEPGGPGGPPPPPDPPPDGGSFAAPSITQSSNPTNADTAKKDLWTGSYRILVTSSTGDPVSGVTVEYRWNGTGQPQTCTTTGTGECLIGDTFDDSATSLTIKVTAMSKTNWTVPAGVLPVTSGTFSCSPPLSPSCD